MKRYLLPAILCTVAFGLGVATQYYCLPARVVALMQTPPTRPLVHDTLRGDDSVPREEVSPDVLLGKRVWVLVSAGQSNAANPGDTRHEPGPAVYNFHAGKLYKAKDPLLGASGSGGSVWSRLADKLIASGACDAVVLAPVAVGGSSVQEWAPRGHLHPLLLVVLRDLRRIGLPATHLLWHQGESDHRTSEDAYRQQLEAIIASAQPLSPRLRVYVARASRVGDQISESVRRAQKSVVDQGGGIYPGPDTDTLTGEDRNATDRVHFSERGLERAAGLWHESLTTTR